MAGFFKEIEDAMPKGYIVVSYRDAPNDKNLSKYAPKALEAMTNAGPRSSGQTLKTSVSFDYLNCSLLSFWGVVPQMKRLLAIIASSLALAGCMGGVDGWRDFWRSIRR